MSLEPSIPPRLLYSMSQLGIDPQDAVSRLLESLSALGATVVEMLESRVTLVARIEYREELCIARSPLQRFDHADAYALSAARHDAGPRRIAVHGDVSLWQSCAGRFFDLDSAGETRRREALRVLDALAPITAHVSSLRARLDHFEDSLREGAAHLPDGARVYREMCVAGAVLHELISEDRHVCHGDLHQQNVLTSPDRRVRIIDPEPHLGAPEMDAVKLSRTLGLPDTWLYAHFRSDVLDAVRVYYDLRSVLYKASRAGECTRR